MTQRVLVSSPTIFFSSCRRTGRLKVIGQHRDPLRVLGSCFPGDVALVKMPAGKVNSRRKFYEQKANDQMDAVNAQLMKSSDSRMPITNSSRSVTTKGRVPSFQD